MRKLYLTIGVKATELEIALGNIKMLDINDVIDKYPEVMVSPVGHKPTAILKYLDDDTQQSLLIANAIDTVRDYTTLKAGLKDRDVIVEKFFVKIPSFTEAELDEMYGSVSTRHLDYSRSELNHLADGYQNKIQRLIDFMKANGDKVDLL